MNSKIDIVIEYLIGQGTLTGTLDNVEFTHDNDVYSISKWTFPQVQLTDGELQTVYDSANFQTYLLDRNNIVSRNDARNLVDTRMKRYALVSLDEINILRKFNRDLLAAIAAAATLANLKTLAAAIGTAANNYPDRTTTQFKNAMDIKD